MLSFSSYQPASKLGTACSGTFGIAMLSSVSLQAQNADDLNEDALRAAPPGIHETATVSDLEGNVLREGSGAYTCFPAPESIAEPVCMKAKWLRWMKAWMSQKSFTTEYVGIAYMLAGHNANGGASNTDPAATEPTADNDWVVERPHVMVITSYPNELEALPVTTDIGGPYVMWSGTPYAHVLPPRWPTAALARTFGGNRAAWNMRADQKVQYSCRAFTGAGDRDCPK